MASASALRIQIEASLAHRIPSALTPVAKAIRPVLPTGVETVDELVGGGLPVGAISEFAGPESSGRTSLALSFLARITQAARVGVWIDVEDGFDPESAAAAGVDLQRLLWVRCSVPAAHPQCHRENGFRLPDKFLVPPEVKKGLHGGGFGPHPRTEIQGLSGAVGEFLRPQFLRTKSLAPRSAQTQLQKKREREALMPVAQTSAFQASPHARPGKPWTRIEQALRTADLLLQAGGFAAIVLDMAGIAPEYAMRVSMATWFRYRAAAERTRTSLLVLTQHACAKSSGELLLRFQPGRACGDEATVFTGLEYRLEVERGRFMQRPANVVPMRKPPQRESGTQWRSRSTWAGAR